MALREDFSTALLGGEYVNDYVRALLVHVVKRRGIGMPGPQKAVVRGHGTFEASCEALVEYLLKRNDLNYVEHCSCVRKAIAWERKDR